MTNKTDIGGFDVEVASIGHSKVELVKTEEHSAWTVKSLAIGDGLKPCSVSFEGHGLEFNYTLLVVFINSHINEKRGDTDKFEEIIVLNSHIVIQQVTSIEKGINLNEIIKSHTVGQLHTSY